VPYKSWSSLCLCPHEGGACGQRRKSSGGNTAAPAIIIYNKN